MSTYAGYPFVPAAHYRTGRTAPPTVIVVHTAECLLGLHADEAVAAFFHNQPADDPNPTSAHAMADSDSLIRMVRDTDTAYAAGTHGNRIGLHIEQAGKAAYGPATWASALARAQVGWVAQQVAAWCVRWDIPPVRIGPADLLAGRRGICGHVDVTHAWPADTTHTDPGTDYPWSTLLERVSVILDPPARPPVPVPRSHAMSAMYLRGSGPYEGHAILLEGGKQLALGVAHGNAFSADQLPYANVKDAKQDLVYDEAFGPIVG